MCTETTWTTDLEARIEAAYAASGNSLGWRFLYSPATVLSGAEAAIIGLNPAGRVRPLHHPAFSMDWGSAYARERWGDYPPGGSPLQRQVLALCRHLGVQPDAVLAGNLVPFRSPRWNALANRPEALRFGRELWSEVIARARPDLVVTIGRAATEALAAILGTGPLVAVPIRWGNVSAYHGRFAGGALVGLPHLSTFKIITRSASALALQEIFKERWQA